MRKSRNLSNQRKINVYYSLLFFCIVICGLSLLIMSQIAIPIFPQKMICAVMLPLSLSLMINLANLKVFIYENSGEVYL